MAVTVGTGLVSDVSRGINHWRSQGELWILLLMYTLSIPFQDDKFSLIKIRSSTVNREKLLSFRVRKCKGRVFTRLR